MGAVSPLTTLEKLVGVMSWAVLRNSQGCAEFTIYKNACIWSYGAGDDAHGKLVLLMEGQDVVLGCRRSLSA